MIQGLIKRSEMIELIANEQKSAKHKAAVAVPQYKWVEAGCMCIANRMHQHHPKPLGCGIDSAKITEEPNS